MSVPFCPLPFCPVTVWTSQAALHSSNYVQSSLGGSHQWGLSVMKITSGLRKIAINVRKRIAHGNRLLKILRDLATQWLSSYAISKRYIYRLKHTTRDSNLPRTRQDDKTIATIYLDTCWCWSIDKKHRDLNSKRMSKLDTSSVTTCAWNVWLWNAKKNAVGFRRLTKSAHFASSTKEEHKKVNELL